MGTVGRETEFGGQLAERDPRAQPLLALVQPDNPQNLGVDDRSPKTQSVLAQRIATEAVCATRIAPVSAGSSVSSASDRDGASARSAARMPCTGIDASPISPSGLTRPETARLSCRRPSSIGIAPTEMISSRAGSSPVSSKSSEHQRAERHGVRRPGSAASA